MSFPNLGTAYLFDDAVQYWTPVSSWYSNSSCNVGLAGVGGSGATATVAFWIGFVDTAGPTLAGFCYYDEYVADQLGGTAGWGTIPGTLYVDMYAPLPDGYVGAPYSWSYTASGGVPPYIWTASSLPPGLTMSSAGVLSGTPTSAGNWGMWLGFNGWEAYYILTIANPLPLTITTPSPLSPGILSVGYTTALAAQGGIQPYTWSLQSGSAAGLTLSPGGTLSGAPTASGNSTFVVKVTDSVGASATVSYGLFVASTSFTATPAAFTTGYMPVTKVGVFRNGAAFLEDSNGNAIYDAGTDRYIPNFTGPNGFITGDIPVAGDWTGDGQAKVGIYRQSSGQWFLDTNNDGVWDPGDLGYPSGYAFGGIPGDIPVTGDWTGLGKSCIGLFRQGWSWLLDLNCNGSFDNAPPDAFFGFGGLFAGQPQADVPVVGKWVAGRPTRVGVVRAYAPDGVPGPCASSTAFSGCPFFWVLDGSNPNAGNLPANHQPDANCFAFGGLFGDVFVDGNWDGGSTSMGGAYRGGFWVLDAGHHGDPQSSQVPGLAFWYGGLASDVPVTGTWGPGNLPPAITMTPPSPITIAQGGSSSFTQQVTVGNISSASVTLTAGALPQGVTVTFGQPGASQATITAPGSILVTVSASSSAIPSPVGTPYAITITATYVPSITSTTTVSVTVTPPPTFTISAPPPFTVPLPAPNNTSSATFSTTITGVNGFAGQVSFFAGYQPQPYTTYYATYTDYTGASSAYYQPAQITATLSNFTGAVGTFGGQVTVYNNPPNGSPPPGLYTYFFTLYSTSYGVSTSVVLSVAFNVGTPPAFTLTGPSQVALYAGGTGTPITVTVGPVNGAATPSQVNFNLANQGLNVSVNVPRPPSTPATSPWSATVNIQALIGALIGQATTTINAVGNAGGPPVGLTLSVNIQPAVTITASPPTAIVRTGGSSAITGSITSLNGYAGQVGIAATGLPTGVTANSATAPVSSGGTSPYSLNIAAAAGAQQVTQSMLMTGTPSGASAGATATPTISVSQFSYTNSLGSAPIYVSPGDTANCGTNPSSCFTLTFAVNSGALQVSFGTCYVAPPSTLCQPTGSASESISVSPGSAPISAPGGPMTFTVKVPADAVPSAAHVPASSAAQILVEPFNTVSYPPTTFAYPVPFTVSNGSDVYNDILYVYVTAPPPTQISLNLNLGAIRVYSYNGYTEFNVTPPVTAQTPPTINYPGYSSGTRPAACPVAGQACVAPGTTNNDGENVFLACPPWYTSSPPGYPSPRDCMTRALNVYTSASPGVTGATAMIAICDSDFGWGVIRNCGGSEAGPPYLNLDWPNLFHTFLVDLKNAGITKLALRPSTHSSAQYGTIAIDATSSYLELNHTFVPSCIGMGFQNTTGEPVSGIYANWGFEPAYPLGLVQTGTGAGADYGKYPYNDGYTCIPYNHFNFVGWDTFFAAFNAIFHQMSLDGIQLDAFDLEGEIAPGHGETGTLLMTFDPDTTNVYHNSLTLSCPDVSVVTGVPGTDVLGWLRCIAASNFGHTGPVADAAAGAITMSQIDDQTSQPALPASTCTNVYGDSARVDEPSLFINALLGRPFGDLTDQTTGYDPRSLQVPGLDCTFAAAIPPSLPFLQVTYSTLPEVVDMHAYITLQAGGSGELPADLSAQQTDLVAGHTWTEAIGTFSAFKELLDKYYGSSTLPQSAGRLLIGETHSPTATNVYGLIPQTCEGGASIEARPMFAGLRQSEANLIASDGSQMASPTTYSYGGITIRPFYLADGIDLNGCMGFPAQLTEFGYDKSQP